MVSFLHGPIFALQYVVTWRPTKCGHLGTYNGPEIFKRLSFAQSSFQILSFYTLGSSFSNEYGRHLAGVEELCDIFDYCIGLKFDEKPDYGVIQEAIKAMLEKQDNTSLI